MHKTLRRAWNLFTGRPLAPKLPKLEDVSEKWQNVVDFCKDEGVELDEHKTFIDVCLHERPLNMDQIAQLREYYVDMETRLKRSGGNAALVDMTCLGVMDFLIKEHEQMTEPS